MMTFRPLPVWSGDMERRSLPPKHSPVLPSIWWRSGRGSFHSNTPTGCAMLNLL
jgi:hypothetical protein